MNIHYERGKNGSWGDEWKNVTEDAKDVVRKLLVVDTKKRLTAEQVKIVL